MAGKIPAYMLLDSGHGRRLEQVGPFRLIRPALNAFWRPTRPEAWRTAQFEFVRNPQSGGGQWLKVQPHVSDLPREWTVQYAGLQFLIRLTQFGHLGIFPEHAALYPQIRNFCEIHHLKPNVLNLFAYTGALSLLTSQLGGTVTHCDAAQGIVDWAKQNRTLNPALGNNIRWIVDDAFKFVSREGRRKSIYEGIILDPPSFGRGAQGQVWKIEDALPELLQGCRALLSTQKAAFLFLSCHTPGFTPLVLSRMLHDAFGDLKKPFAVEKDELFTAHEDGSPLPAGGYARIFFPQGL